MKKKKVKKPKDLMKAPGMIKCLMCKEILISHHRHDFQQCGCQNEAYVDGGYDYTRVGAKDFRKVKVL